MPLENGNRVKLLLGQIEKRSGEIRRLLWLVDVMAGGLVDEKVSQNLTPEEKIQILAEILEGIRRARLLIQDQEMSIREVRTLNQMEGQ